MCPIPWNSKDLLPVPAMSNEYITSVLIISKGPGILSIKFTKNAPCEEGIRGVQKTQKWTEKCKKYCKEKCQVKCLRFQCMYEVPMQQHFTRGWWILHSKKLGSDQPKKLYGTVRFGKILDFFKHHRCVWPTLPMTYLSYPAETPVFFYKNCIISCTIQRFGVVPTLHSCSINATSNVDLGLIILGLRLIVLYFCESQDAQNLRSGWITGLW